MNIAVVSDKKIGTGPGRRPGSSRQLGACAAETFEAKRMQSPLSVSIGERA